jgi:hypothetical protein
VHAKEIKRSLAQYMERLRVIAEASKRTHHQVMAEYLVLRHNAKVSIN